MDTTQVHPLILALEHMLSLPGGFTYVPFHRWLVIKDVSLRAHRLFTGQVIPAMIYCLRIHLCFRAFPSVSLTPLVTPALDGSTAPSPPLWTRVSPEYVIGGSFITNYLHRGTVDDTDAQLRVYIPRDVGQPYIASDTPPGRPSARDIEHTHRADTGTEVSTRWIVSAGITVISCKADYAGTLAVATHQCYWCLAGTWLIRTTH